MKWLNRYWKSLLVLLVILLLSFMNPPSLPAVSTLFSFDKVGHLGMYAGLTFILLIDTAAFLAYREHVSWFVIIGVIIQVALGAVTEILQTLLFAPRAAEWGDFLSDAAGVLFGWLAFLVWQRWRPFRRK
jgi:VanZ family protein